MDISAKRVCITGGGGFVGSHLADRLVDDNDVVVADRFGNGRREWVPDEATIVEGDLQDPDVVAAAIDAETDVVFHFAADKRIDTDDPDEQFRLNTALTANVAARMDEVGCRNVAFTSSSTVYGEAPRPTPEDYAPLEPISVYGSAKLADEALISTYAHSYGIQSWVFRFANIVGPHQRGTVVPDFIEKLREDPTELTILGDGRQEKSYLHVTECVEAIRHVVESADRPLNTYNLGTRTTTSVTEIANVVADEMGLDPAYSYTGGDRGWTGDVPKMRLSIEKLAALGYEPSLSSHEVVERGARDREVCS